MNNNVKWSPGDDAAAWLSDSPEDAPNDLPSRTLEQTRAAGQRAARPAGGLGAPTGEPTSRGVSHVRLWIAAGLIVLSLVFVIVGAGLQPHDAVVFAEMRHPIASVGPRASVQPATSVVPSPATPLYNTGFGFSVRGDTSDPWLEVRATWGEHLGVANALDFRFGTCRVVGCAPSTVSVAVNTVAHGGVLVDWDSTCPTPTGTVATDAIDAAISCSIWRADGGGTPVEIAGRTPEELVAGWTARYGATDPQWVWLSDVHWAILEKGASMLAFAANGDRLIAVTAQPAVGLWLAAREGRFRTFIAGIRVDGPATGGTSTTRSASSTGYRIR